MRRREFIALLGGAVATWSFSARAQRSTTPVVGFLGSSSKAVTQQYFSAFSQGMHELGYAEGRNYATETRYADGDRSLLPRLARELVSLQPEVIVADSTQGTLAVKQATSNIPIVGLNMTDPVGLGLAASEAHPGTNITGTLVRVEGLAGKLLEIAVDLEPGVNKIGVLLNTSNPSNVIQRREAVSAAAKLGVRFAPVEVRAVDELEPAFQTFEREGAKIVIVFTDALLINARRQIAALALASRLPTISSRRDLVEDGGLISYGISQHDAYRRAAYYVDRILKGEKPRDLPIEFSTKLELVINNATAKAIGLAIPPTLLARADEVIE
jgi:putative tryptophan/tyrosine transport system substrate-binding protein